MRSSTAAYTSWSASAAADAFYRLDEVFLAPSRMTQYSGAAGAQGIGLIGLIGAS
jgi:hypothetical protein